MNLAANCTPAEQQAGFYCRPVRDINGTIHFTALVLYGTNVLIVKYENGGVDYHGLYLGGPSVFTLQTIFALNGQLQASAHQQLII